MQQKVIIPTEQKLITEQEAIKLYADYEIYFVKENEQSETGYVLAAVSDAKAPYIDEIINEFYNLLEQGKFAILLQGLNILSRSAYMR